MHGRLRGVPRRPPIVVLLPPSEGKAAGGDEPWDAAAGRFPGLARPRRAVAKALAAEMRRLDPEAISRLLGVKGDGLARAIRANKALTRRPPAMPAADRFTGVVHDHLDLRGLKETDDRVVFLSALGGVLGPSDPVPDHRLKMNVRLEGIGGVAAFWRPHIAAALTPVVVGADVVDLLPHEHAAALADIDLSVAASWSRARFEHVRPDGTRQIIGHDAKAAKGLFARHLLQAGAASKAAIESFVAVGTAFDGWDGQTAVFTIPRASFTPRRS